MTFESVDLFLDRTVALTFSGLFALGLPIGRWLLRPVGLGANARLAPPKRGDFAVLVGQLVLGTLVLAFDSLQVTPTELLERVVVLSVLVITWWSLGVWWLSRAQVDDTLRRAAMLAVGVPVAYGWLIALLGPTSPESLLLGLSFLLLLFLSLHSAVLVVPVAAMTAGALVVGSRRLVRWVVNPERKDSVTSASRLRRAALWSATALLGASAVVAVSAPLRVSRCEGAGSPSVRCDMRKIASKWKEHVETAGLAVWAREYVRGQELTFPQQRSEYGPSTNAETFRDVPRAAWPAELHEVASSVAVDRDGRLRVSAEGYCAVVVASGRLPTARRLEWRYLFSDGAYVSCMEK